MNDGITIGRVLKYVALGLGGLAMLVFAFGSWAVVPPGHRGIVIHAGKVQPEVLGEGLTAKLPLYTTVMPVSVRVRQSVIQTTAASKDIQKVHTTVAINWHISPENVMTVFQQLGEDEVIENNIIDKAAAEVLKAATAKLTAEEILLKRNELKLTIDKELITRLALFNLVVDVVNLSDFDFDPEFNKAVEEKQVAEQKVKTATYNAARATQEANAEIEKAKGQAEAQRLLRQNITEDLIQKLAIEKWDGKMPLYFGGNGNLPFLTVGHSATK